MNESVEITKLSEVIAQKISNCIIDVLSQIEFQSPLFCLKLSYLRVADYWPLLIPVTLKFKNWVASEEGPFLADPGDLIDVPKGKIQKEFQFFSQLIEEKKQWDVGANTLQKAAKILTISKLDNKIKTTNDFVAFPIDLTFDEMKLDKVLIKSGADENKIKEWKKLKWF